MPPLGANTRPLRGRREKTNQTPKHQKAAPPIGGSALGEGSGRGQQCKQKLTFGVSKRIFTFVCKLFDTRCKLSFFDSKQKFIYTNNLNNGVKI